MVQVERALKDWDEWIAGTEPVGIHPVGTQAPLPAMSAKHEKSFTP